jgi:Protein of unknown function (DUF2470)
VGTTRLRRPPAPTAAERARSVAARGGTASLVGTGAAPATPLVHLVRADGSAALLLADEDPVLELIRQRDGEVAAMLEITDRAPVDLREPVRALLWITGRVRLPDAESGRRIAVQVADSHPHPDLLRLGHGATLIRLDPDFAVLSDAEGTAALAPVELAAARPDPFCRYEKQWLAHLEMAHPEVFDALARYLPSPLRDRPARVRPLAVDRCGLRLRVETTEGDHDVRLAWQDGAHTVAELRVQMGLLVGCPFRDPTADRPIS